MAGNQAWYRPQERAAGLFAVQLLSCQPLALVPSTDKTPKSGQKSDRKMAAARDPGVARRWSLWIIVSV